MLLLLLFFLLLLLQLVVIVIQRVLINSATVNATISKHFSHLVLTFLMKATARDGERVGGGVGFFVAINYVSIQQHFSTLRSSVSPLFLPLRFPFFFLLLSLYIFNLFLKFCFVLFCIFCFQFNSPVWAWAPWLELVSLSVWTFVPVRFPCPV